MADEQFLGLLGNNDLATFNNSVLRSDPYGMAATSIGSWRPDASTWSPGTTAATAFGQAFLTGLLGRYAQQNAAAQTNKVISVLPQLKSDPMSVIAPEGVDADAFANLKANAVLRNQLATAQKESALAELIQKLKLAGPLAQAEARGKTLGENSAKQEIYGPNFEDPESPIAKAKRDDEKRQLDLDSRITDARNYLKAAGAPYVTARENLDLLTKNFKESSPATDLIYAVAANKILDPTAIVRPDDVQNIQAMVPYLEKSIAGFKNYITPEGTLKPEGKAMILRAIAPKLEAMGQNYKGLLDTETKRLQLLGADPSLLSATPYQPFDLSSLLGAGTGGDVSAKYAALRAQGLSKEDAGRQLGLVP